MFKKITLFITLIIFIAIPLSINVQQALAKENNKTIYLTFDDGLCPKITEEIVDILNKENVKGTFFLIGNTLETYPICLNKIIATGHSVGLHSYTHDRAKLYNSDENFIKEMEKSRDELFKLTGIKSNIIRFPFGTNNNSFKLNKNLETKLHNLNFKIYDWNVDTKDGEFPHNSSYNIYKNGISDKDTIIILMHSTACNKNSCVALKDIIKYYKDNGYEFKAITDDTPEMYKLKRISLQNFLEF